MLPTRTSLQTELNATPMLDVLLVLLITDFVISIRLRAIYDVRPDKIIQIAGDSAVRYQDVVHAMDVAKSAGVKAIGIAPKASR